MKCCFILVKGNKISISTSSPLSTCTLVCFRISSPHGCDMGMPFRVSLHTAALHPIRLREASFPVTAATNKQTDNPQMCSGVQMELSFPLPKYYRCQPPAEDAKKSRTASLSLQINYVKRLLYLTSNLLHNYNL